MNQIIKSLFTPQYTTPLFIFEMANNHMGNLHHGLRIIREFHKISKEFPFKFAFKFQFRNIDTFIHPGYKNRMDIKYVKRFIDTELSEKDFKTLKDELDRLGFISICTPFDEPSVDKICRLNFDILKIASCSFTDWPLLEKIASTNKPIIASTAAVPLEDIDKVVLFLKNREKLFALMHCVGEYPTARNNLQLNQIDLLKNKYSDIVIGYSTHEEPNNYDTIKMAIAKGARIFEKHVAVASPKYEVNAYSVVPDEARLWLESAQEAFRMNGTPNQRHSFSTKEVADLRQFQRGMFAKATIKKDEKVDFSNVFFAFPNTEGQLMANDFSKYTNYYLKKTIKPLAPILVKDCKKEEIEERIFTIIKYANSLLKKYNIPFSRKNTDVEISHHYGIDLFEKYGGILMSFVNRAYCKKIIVMFKGQKHPTQFHNKKEETFHILGGEFYVVLNGKRKLYKTGDIVTVLPGVRHSMEAKTDGIIEEISSTHYKEDSFYEDSSISANKYRKTHLTYWL